MLVDKSGSFGAAMTIIDTDVGSKRRGKDLALIFEVVVRLHDGDGEITGGVGFKVSMPHENIAAGPHTEATFERP
ncbi:hypothetical protein GQ457_10G020400 [Hibiscus cannabinus]